MQKIHNQIYINLHCRCVHPELYENTYFIYIPFLNNVWHSHFMPRCPVHGHAKTNLDLTIYPLWKSTKVSYITWQHFCCRLPKNSDNVIFNDQAASPATSLVHQGSFVKYAESVSSKKRLRLSKELKARIVPGFLTVTGDMLK